MWVVVGIDDNLKGVNKEGIKWVGTERKWCAVHPQEVWAQKFTSTRLGRPSHMAAGRQTASQRLGSYGTASRYKLDFDFARVSDATSLPYCSAS